MWVTPRQQLDLDSYWVDPVAYPYKVRKVRNHPCENAHLVEYEILKFPF